MKPDTYIVIARKPGGTYFSDTVSTDTPRSDFREIYRHSSYDIVQAISVSEIGLEKIAAERLQIDTLKTQNSDDKDFHTSAIWNIRAALFEAYAKGYKDALKHISDRGQPKTTGAT